MKEHETDRAALGLTKRDGARATKKRIRNGAKVAMGPPRKIVRRMALEMLRNHADLVLQGPALVSVARRSAGDRAVSPKAVKGILNPLPHLMDSVGLCSLPGRSGGVAENVGVAVLWIDGYDGMTLSRASFLVKTPEDGLWMTAWRNW